MVMEGSKWVDDVVGEGWGMLGIGWVGVGGWGYEGMEMLVDW